MSNTNNAITQAETKDLLKKLAKKVSDYIVFRDIQLDPGWLETDVEFNKQILETGITEIIGIVVDIEHGKIIKDKSNRQAFSIWTGEKDGSVPVFKYYENWDNGIFYIRGVRDSRTRKPVYAVVKNADNEYYILPVKFYVANLPDGVYYVDCEDNSNSITEDKK